MIDCVQCRADNAEGNVFCVRCGADLEAQRTPTAPDPGSSGSGPDGATRLEPTAQTADLRPGCLLETGRHRLDAVLGTAGIQRAGYTVWWVLGVALVAAVGLLLFLVQEQPVREQQSVKETVQPPTADLSSPPKPPPAAPVVQVARLVVHSDLEGARVTIDGRDQGPPGPDPYEVEPGNHTVRVEKNGYDPYEEPVKLAAGETHTVHAELAQITTVAPPGMVLVPAGKFYFGCNEAIDRNCFSNEKPGSWITLPAFSIDKTEVTVSAYAECVRAGKCKRAAASGQCNRGKPGREDHPINCVKWDDAVAYCRWAGKRLPTEQEWEKAARGTDGRKYPWGNEKASCRYAVLRDGGYGCGLGRTWPVGSKPLGASPYGALDMAGNVWEWTTSFLYPQEERRVLRGGSWAYTPRTLRASCRRGIAPEARREYGGFRCVRSESTSEH